METKMKVLVTSSDYPEKGMKILRDKCDVIQSKLNGFLNKEHDRAEIEKLIAGVDGIIWCTTVYLDKDLIEKAGDKLKVVSAMSAGTDNVDKNELKLRNIALGNTPDVLNSAVADLAIMLMIAASRGITGGLNRIKSGKWGIGPQSHLGVDIKGSVIGIIGFGSIGQAIAKRLIGFEVRKFIYTGHKSRPEADEFAASFVTLDELLAQSDFVILSCSLNESTVNLMNAERFSKMKKSAVLINVSRGGVVDQNALIEALKNKTIYAAGLDVMTPEPLPSDSPLISLPNCFLTPHMGSATINTRNNMAELSALNVILGMQGERLLTSAM